MFDLKRPFLAAVLLWAAPVSAETLKFAHFVAPTHTLTKAIVDPLTEGVAVSGLKIDTYPAGKLGAGPADQYLRVVQGVADIAWGLPGYTSAQFPLTMLSELPGAKPKDMSGADFLWNGWDAGILAREFPATEPLALWTAEDAVLILRDKRVTSPSDLKGLKIRVSSSSSADAITALGAVPVQMPAGDVYNAIQTGLIDGLVSGASAISDFKFDEVLGHVTTGIPLGHQVFFVVINKAKIDSLPEDEATSLRAVATRELSRHAEALWNEKADAALTALRAEGGIVDDLNADEIAAFEAILLPLTKTAIEKQGAAAAYNALLGRKP